MRNQKDADLIDHVELQKLAGEPYIYLAEYEGVISESDRKSSSMILKPGMRVMSVIRWNKL